MEDETQLKANTNAEESWKVFKKVVMGAAEGICGGGKPPERDIWWCSEEVQESMRRMHPRNGRCRVETN